MSALPHISRGLLIRGGAVAAAAVSSTLTSTDAQTALTDDFPSSTEAALSVSGGGTSEEDGNISLFGLTITPEARATLAMVSQKRLLQLTKHGCAGCCDITCTGQKPGRMNRYASARIVWAFASIWQIAADRILQIEPSLHSSTSHHVARSHLANKSKQTNNSMRYRLWPWRRIMVRTALPVRRRYLSSHRPKQDLVVRPRHIRSPWALYPRHL